MIAARALGWRAPKIRVGKKPLQQGCDRPAPCGKRPSAIEVAAESFTRPGVEQNVARSCVEACNGTFAGKIGQVGYTAEIDDDAVAAWVPENSRMKRRYERCTLPARSDVAAPEIGDHRNARALRKPRRVTKLQAVPGSRPMTHCLPVTTDGGYGLRVDAVFLKEAFGRLSVKPREFDPCKGCTMQLVAGPLVQGEQGAFQGLRIRQEPGTQKKRSALQVDEDGIDAVEARARHQTDVDLGRCRSRGTAHSSSARSPFFRRSSRAMTGSAVRLNAARSIAGIGCAAGKAMVSGLRFWSRR